MSWHAQCPSSAHAPDATEDEMQSREQNLQFYRVYMLVMHGKLGESAMTGSTGAAHRRSGGARHHAAGLA